MKLPACLLLLALSSTHAIDFTPREVKEVGEGGEYTYLRFSDHDKAVTYMPPANWRYSGGGQFFHLSVPNVVGCEVEISISPMEKPLVASEADLKTFEAMAMESLPKGARSFETTVATFNPCEIDGHQTVEVTLSYVLFGQPKSVSQLYLPRTKDMVRFTVVAKPEDFEQVRRRFQGSLHSLAGL